MCTEPRVRVKNGNDTVIKKYIFLSHHYHGNYEKIVNLKILKKI